MLFIDDMPCLIRCLVQSFLEFFNGVHGEDHYLLALLQIMTFQLKKLTKKLPIGH